MLEKFKSRKFILAALGVISGIAAVLSDIGGEVGLVAAIVVIIASVVTYIVTEGKIDQAAVNLSYDSIKKIIDMIKEYEKDVKTDSHLSNINVEGSVGVGKNVASVKWFDADFKNKQL